jgi:hypothetical protein
VLAGLTVKDVKAGFDFTCWIAGESGSSLLDGAFCSGSITDSDVPVAVDFSEIDGEIFIDLSASADGVALTVSPNGAVAADSVDLTVVTNNANGYDLMIKGTSSADLVCAGSAAIEPQSVDGAALEVNHWGYEIGVSEPSLWGGVSVVDALLDNYGSSTSSEGRETRTWFATRANFALPACAAYGGGVTFSAVIGV